MTSPLTRAHVRTMEADHRQRLQRAQVQGNFLAVAHDITDELNDALAFLGANYGEAEIYRFKWLYAEAQREASMQGVSFEIPGMTQPRVVTQSQLPGPKRSNGGAVVVLAVLFALGLLFGAMS